MALSAVIQYDAVPTRFRLPVGLLVLLNIVVFWGVWGHSFTRFDDDIYVYANPLVTEGLTARGIKAALTETEIGHWHPVTWLSHMADCSVFGLRPGGHHLVSLLLHITNTLLLFWLLSKATGALWKSWVVAALFAVNPLNVEPVVWISSRKDVLSTAFWLLAAIVYVVYCRKPTVVKYLAVAFLTALGLASKPMVATLPATLLLLDLWPLNRFTLPASLVDWQNFKMLGWRLLEKVPLLLLAVGSLLISLTALRSGEVLTSLDALPLTVRLAYVPINYIAYLRSFFWPSGLIPIYPHPGPSVPILQLVTAVLLLGIVSFLVIRNARSRPYLAMGWVWFLVTLLPVIGLIHFAAHIRADRYMYVPIIGILVIIVWGGAELLEKVPVGNSRRLVVTCLLALLLAFGAAASLQARRWRSDRVLIEHILAVCPRHAPAENNLGLVLAEEGHFEEAVPHFQKSLAIRPGNLESMVNLGTVLNGLNRTDQAIAVYRKAVQLHPRSATLRMNLANALVRSRQYGEASEHYEAALAVDPNSGLLHYNVGRYLEITGQWDQALSHYRRLLLQPAYARLGKDGIRRVEAAKAASRGRPD